MRITANPSTPLALILCMLALAALATPSQAGEAGDDKRWTLIEKRVGQGEQCLVCGQRIYDSEIVEVRYGGRTFHVAAEMLADFDQSPGTYFYRLEAHSGLFDEGAIPATPLSNGWLFFSSYVVIGLIFAAFCGYLAIGRGLTPVSWFFAGLVGNIAALALLLLTPRGDSTGVPPGLAKLSRTPLPRPCPSCAALNHPSATACASCQAPLSPTSEPENARI